MKTVALFLALFAMLTLAVPCSAQEGEAGHGDDLRVEVPGEESHDDSHANVDFWKTVNFTILAIGLGWLIKKFAGGYFRDQTAKIQQGIVDAKKTQEEAEARASEIERRMSGLDEQIAELRSQAKSELSHEESRLREQTEQMIARVETNARQEIASATKQARNDLRAYAADLALEIAREKVRERMTPEISGRLVDRLITDLGRLSQRVN